MLPATVTPTPACHWLVSRLATGSMNVNARKRPAQASNRACNWFTSASVIPEYSNCQLSIDPLGSKYVSTDPSSVRVSTVRTDLVRLTGYCTSAPVDSWGKNRLAIGFLNANSCRATSNSYVLRQNGRIADSAILYSFTRYGIRKRKQPRI